MAYEEMTEEEEKEILEEMAYKEWEENELAELWNDDKFHLTVAPQPENPVQPKPLDATQVKKIEKEQMDRMTSARSILILDQEFFATGVLSLELQINWRIPTAATNGKKIWFNPSFVASLSIDEIMGLLCHEWMHVMFLHPFRMGDRNHRVFNIAGDAVINYILLYENKLKLPNPRIDRQDACGKDTEEMYDIVFKELIPPDEPGKDGESEPGEEEEGEDGDGGSDESEKGDDEGDGQPGSDSNKKGEEEGDGQGGGEEDVESDETEAEGNSGEPEEESPKEEVEGDSKGGGTKSEEDEKGQPSQEKISNESFDEVIPYEGDDEETIQEAESRVKETVEKALMIARQRGTIPGWAEDIIKSLYEPVVPWEQIVQQWFSEKAKEDYTWKRPNRRYSDIYLPRLESPAVGHIAFLEDTSGSMQDIELSQISGQLEYLMDVFRMQMTIIYFDSRVQGIVEVERGDKIVLDKHPGRGGTDFRVGFKKLEELNLIQDLKGIVVLTDGECSQFPEDPGIDVLWILVRQYERFKPPFGQVVTFRK